MTPKRNGMRRRNGCSNASTPSTLSFGANGGCGGHRATRSVSPRSVQPARQVLGDEGVVGEVGMLQADAVDRLAPGPGSAPRPGRGTSVPSSRPWRRSTSWQPAMQPWKSLATSKKALLQSVTRLSSASSSRSTAPPCRHPARPRSPCSARAARPRLSSTPTSGRAGRRESAPSPARRRASARNGVIRSRTMWSSLPV